MKTEPISRKNDIDFFTRILHLGLAVFGLLAWATGEMADDYKNMEAYGYLLHSWIGIGITFFISSRFIYGVLGPVHMRFNNWVPYNKERIKIVLEDITGLGHLRLPDRQPRQGLAALVEILGLLLFFFLAATGILLFNAIEPGHKAQGVAHFIKELHEVGEMMLPLFFLVHAGAAILHALTGKHLWRKMIFLKEK